MVADVILHWLGVGFFILVGGHMVYAVLRDLCVVWPLSLTWISTGPTEPQRRRDTRPQYTNRHRQEWTL